MNINFLDCCYNIATLSTCVLNEQNSELWGYGKTEQIKVTDDLTAIARYAFLGSDYLSPFDYENHIFSIDFLRNGNLIDTFTFPKKLDHIMYGSLANPNLGIEEKLDGIKKVYPGHEIKLKSVLSSSLLTQEEVRAIINKNNELSNLVNEMKNNIKTI